METKLDIVFKEESYAIIGAAMEVHRELGCGFTEPVYQDALEYEFQLRKIPYQREMPISVVYKGKSLGKCFRADFVCFDKIIVELKAVQSLVNEYYAQVYNYLKAGGFDLGLLINFGQTSLEYERIVKKQKWSQKQWPTAKIR